MPVLEIINYFNAVRYCCKLRRSEVSLALDVSRVVRLFKRTAAWKVG